nr:alpha/beta hydrolase [Spirochaetaceae bacterium]
LVGHSLGGAIIRAYSLKFPERVSGLIFIDTIDESWLKNLSDEEIDNNEKEQLEFARERGVSGRAYKEKEEVFNTLKYLALLEPLPDVPVINLFSMGYNNEPIFKIHSKSVSQILGKGLSDFTHIEVSDSGHKIHCDQPDLVISSILEVLNKIH